MKKNNILYFLLGILTLAVVFLGYNNLVAQKDLQNGGSKSSKSQISSSSIQNLTTYTDVDSPTFSFKYDPNKWDLKTILGAGHGEETTIPGEKRVNKEVVLTSKDKNSTLTFTFYRGIGVGGSQYCLDNANKIVSIGDGFNRIEQGTQEGKMKFGFSNNSIITDKNIFAPEGAVVASCKKTDYAGISGAMAIKDKTFVSVNLLTSNKDIADDVVKTIKFEKYIDGRENAAASSVISSTVVSPPSSASSNQNNLQTYTDSDIPAISFKYDPGIWTVKTEYGASNGKSWPDQNGKEFNVVDKTVILDSKYGQLSLMIGKNMQRGYYPNCVKNQNQITDIENNLVRVIDSANILYTNNDVQTSKQALDSAAVGGCATGDYAVVPSVISLKDQNGVIQANYKESVFDVETGRSLADNVMKTLTW